MKLIKKVALGCLLTLKFAVLVIPVTAQSEQDKKQNNIHIAALSGVIVAIPHLSQINLRT